MKEHSRMVAGLKKRKKKLPGEGKLGMDLFTSKASKHFGERGLPVQAWLCLTGKRFDYE